MIAGGSLTANMFALHIIDLNNILASYDLMNCGKALRVIFKL